MSDALNILRGAFFILVAYSAIKVGGQTLTGVWVPGGTDSPQASVATMTITVPFNTSLLPHSGSVDVAGIGLWLYRMVSDLAVFSDTRHGVTLDNLESVDGPGLILNDGYSFGDDGFGNPTTYHGLGHLPTDIIGAPTGRGVDHSCAVQWFNHATDNQYLWDAEFLANCLDDSVEWLGTASYTTPGGELFFPAPCSTATVRCSPKAVSGSFVPAIMYDGQYCYKAPYFWSDVGSEFASRCGIEIQPHVKRPTQAYSWHMSIVGGVPYMNGSPLLQFYHVYGCPVGYSSISECDHQYAELEAADGDKLVARLSNPLETFDLIFELVDLNVPLRRRRCFCIITCLGVGHCGGGGASKASVQKAVDQLTAEINNNRDQINALATTTQAALDSQQASIDALATGQDALASGLAALAAFAYGTDMTLESEIAEIHAAIHELHNVVQTDALSDIERASIIRSQLSFVTGAVSDLAMQVYRNTVLDLDDTGNYARLLGDSWVLKVAEILSHVGYFPVNMDDPIRGARVVNTEAGAVISLDFVVAPIGSVYHVDRFEQVESVPLHPNNGQPVYSGCTWNVHSAFRLVAPVNVSFAAENYTAPNFLDVVRANATGSNVTGIGSTPIYIRSCSRCLPTQARDTGGTTLAVLFPAVPICTSPGHVSMSVVHATEHGKDVSVSVSPGRPLTVGITWSNTMRTLDLNYGLFADITRQLSTSQLLSEWSVGADNSTIDFVNVTNTAPFPASTYLQSVAAADRQVNETDYVMRDIDDRLHHIENVTAEHFNSPIIHGSDEHCSSEFAGICFDTIEHIVIVGVVVIALSVIGFFLLKCAIKSGACAKNKARATRLNGEQPMVVNPTANRTNPEKPREANQRSRGQPQYAAWDAGERAESNV